MSQKREKEETLDFKVPPSSKETSLSVAALCPENCKISSTATQTCSGSTSPDSTRPDPVHPPPDHPDNSSDTRDSSSASEAVAKKPRQVRGAASSKNSAVNRCSGCGKRVGLTGFRCRCGDLFCSVHRYSDRHDCSFDYKAAGREAIARDNPVVRAAKILKV